MSPGRKVPLGNPTYLLALVACLGCLLLAFANLHQERVVHWILADPAESAFRMRALLALLGVIGVLPVALMAFFAGRLSLAVSASGRYPPPGVELGRRIRVREGAEAHSMARSLRFVAILLCVITVGTPILFWMLAVTITPR